MISLVNEEVKKIERGKIIKIIKIKNCYMCPRWKNGKCRGWITGSTSDDISKIPDWCPLEDYKENKAI